MFDLFLDYLQVLKYISIVLLVILFIFGLDDLFIDAYFWMRKLRRNRSVYTQFKRANPNDLFVPKQKPIAILVPAWQEVGVVGPMADAAVKTLQYENYQIFVGTTKTCSKSKAGAIDCTGFGKQRASGRTLHLW